MKRLQLTIRNQQDAMKRVLFPIFFVAVFGVWFFSFTTQVKSQETNTPTDTPSLTPTDSMTPTVFLTFTETPSATAAVTKWGTGFTS